MPAHNVFLAVFAAGLVLAAPLAAAELSKEELIALAVEQGTCSGDLSPVDAYYETPTTVRIVCGEATGFLPVAGALGFGGGAAAAAAGLALMAAGGGGGEATTTTTPSTN